MAWPSKSRTCVESMSRGDFYSTEQSAIIDHACSLSIILKKPDGT